MARPLPEPVLFLDECLGSTDVPDALRKEGIRVEMLHEHFDLATQDTTWLAEVGKRGWVVLTKDQRIRRRRVARRHRHGEQGVRTALASRSTGAQRPEASARRADLPSQPCVDTEHAGANART